MTIAEFRQRFGEIKKLGWVPSKRRGPTGVGHTFEQLMGLTENNIALPDLGEVELKTHRVDSTSMITLFTFNRRAWKMNQLDAVRKFGVPDENGRLGLYFTMSRMPNSAGLFLHIDEAAISVRHISGVVVVEWRLTDLARQFMAKVPALILVSAQSEIRGDKKWFRFTRARLLRGTSPSIIKD
ncbi:MAG: MvaI/BcnI family restriction endonuclease, partial [candidate division WOR-3 bacterium]